MAQQQPSLFPVEMRARIAAADKLEELLALRAEEQERWREEGKAHKDTLATYDKGISEQCAIIKRAKQEEREGLTSEQVDVLLAQAREHEEG